MESASDAEDDGTNAEGEETPGSHENNGDAGTGEVGEQDHTQELSTVEQPSRRFTRCHREKSRKHGDQGRLRRRHMDDSDTLGSEALRSITEVLKIFASQTLHAPYLTQAEANEWCSSTVNAVAMAFDKQAAAIDQQNQIAKSGDLDMNQLHNYKLTDDLFLRNEIQANGKNHAMTIVIDWSGSMRGKCESTMTQAVTFAMFCQKLNIPCEVFVFQSGVQDTFDDGEFNQGARLSQIIDTTARKSVFMNDCKNALVLGVGHDARYNSVDDFSMGSTPLGPSLAITKFTHNDLMKRTGSEIGTIIFLTDGDGDCGLSWNNRGRKPAPWSIRSASEPTLVLVAMPPQSGTGFVARLVQRSSTSSCVTREKAIDSSSGEPMVVTKRSRLPRSSSRRSLGLSSARAMPSEMVGMLPSLSSIVLPLHWTKRLIRCTM